MNKSVLFCMLFSGILLAGCNFSLAADVTPPPGYQQQEIAAGNPEVTAGLVYPLVAPDPGAGKPIYEEKCAPCHGTAGLGDGERAKDLPNPVTALGAPELARQASPERWFQIVTQGNLEKFMPPFPSLSDRQRWDVVAYAFTLSLPVGQIEAGRALYVEKCVSCHGTHGAGDGAQAGSLKLPDFRRGEYAASKSLAAYYQAINAGISPGMPAFASVLTEADGWALAGYIRSLSFTNVTFAEAASPEEVSGTVTPVPQVLSPTEALNQEGLTNPSFGVVKGMVENASGGGAPTGQEVMLHAFDQMQLVYTATAKIQVDGSYAFEKVDLKPGLAYFSTIQYAGVIYGSELVQTKTDGEAVLDLPIRVFESTGDPSVLLVDRLHYFFELLDENTLRVVELYIVSNPTDRTVIAATEKGPVIQYSLPPEAKNLEFQDGELGGRYQRTEDGFSDSLPIRPGSGVYQVLFTYELPYDRKLNLSRPMALNTNAVVILVPESSVAVKADNLQDAGARDVQGAQYHMYQTGGLRKGEILNLVVSGRTVRTSLALSSSQNSNLLIGFGALGIVFILVGVWMFQRNRLNGAIKTTMQIQPQKEETTEMVMDAILALDDLYQDGKLPEEAYLQRRGELKARLLELTHDTD